MNYYCLVADILGFSNLMRNLPESERAARVQEWYEMVNTAAADLKIQHWQFVSDTVFAGAPEEDGPEALINLARTLLERGVAPSLPVRGSISLGEAQWGDPFAFGPGIVEAHSFCEAQSWVGVAATPWPRENAGLWSRTGLIVYPTPLRAGAVQMHANVVWAVPPLGELIEALSRRGLVRDGQLMDWRWAEIVQNTALFGLYLSLLPPGADLSRFYGLVPLEPIARTLVRAQELVEELNSSGGEE